MTEKFITINIKGGIGNQMFQIALLYGIADQLGRKLILQKNQFIECRQGSHPSIYYNTFFDKIIFVDKYNPTGKLVYITLESKSLGDTMAWFPYIDEFRKKWNCSVVCSTFHNNLFVDQYSNLEFVAPGTIVPDVYATYRIGLFFDQGNIDYTKHRKDPTKLSLLEMATDILGLEYQEVRPKLRKSNIQKKKRVGIGLHSTAQTKYWNNPNGWQELTDFLISQGYEVVMMSKEEDGYMGNFYPKGVVKLPENSFDDLVDNLNSCEFFIGISSGLSWLAWAVNIPVVLISGFTGEYMEPTDNVIRIIEKNVCNDCWSRHKFDAGDWNWCPDQK
jgi:autotransporter strand-loop-strand O-heptosyltransferase